MNNPWKEIDLADYENHMKLDTVMQLQTMNSMMKNQFGDYPVSTAMVLGIAGGNGLEHVSKDKFEAVYGVDINEDYLRVVKEGSTLDISFSQRLNLPAGNGANCEMALELTVPLSSKKEAGFAFEMYHPARDCESLEGLVRSLLGSHCCLQ